MARLFGFRRLLGVEEGSPDGLMAVGLAFFFLLALIITSKAERCDAGDALDATRRLAEFR